MDAIEGYSHQEGLHLQGNLGYHWSSGQEPNRYFNVLLTVLTGRDVFL